MERRCESLVLFASSFCMKDDLQLFVKSDENCSSSTFPSLMTQTGWPSNEDTWKANSASAVTSVKQEKDYFDLLDSKVSVRDRRKSRDIKEPSLEIY